MAASLDRRVSDLETRISAGASEALGAIFLIGLDVPEEAPKLARWAEHLVHRLAGEALAAFQARALATFQAMPRHTAGAPLLITLEIEP